jgi:hypothetical protein
MNRKGFERERSWSNGIFLERLGETAEDLNQDSWLEASTSQINIWSVTAVTTLQSVLTIYRLKPL